MIKNKEYIKYTWEHKKVLLKVEKIIFEKNTFLL